MDWQQMTGFQSPCAEYAEERLSLDKKFLSNPPAMFPVKVSSDSLQFNIKKGDYLIIDRSLLPKHNDLVIAVINSEFKIARLDLIRNKRGLLLPYNILMGVDEEDNNFIWGVVSSLHRRIHP